MIHRMVSKKGGGIYEGGRGCEGYSIYEVVEGGRVFSEESGGRVVEEG